MNRFFSLNRFGCAFVRSFLRPVVSIYNSYKPAPFAINLDQNHYSSNRDYLWGSHDESGLQMDQIDFSISLKKAICEKQVSNRSMWAWCKQSLNLFCSPKLPPGYKKHSKTVIYSGAFQCIVYLIKKIATGKYLTFKQFSTALHIFIFLQVKLINYDADSFGLMRWPDLLP